MKRFTTFAAGAVAALAFTITCGGVPGVDGETPDAGTSTAADGGSIVPAGPAPLSRSGSRIKATGYRGSDGVQIQTGWTDSELGFACTPLGSSSGTRCLPSALTLPTLFTDDQCESPVLSWSGGYSPPSVVSVVDASIVVQSVRRVAGEYSGSLFRKPTGTCEPTVAPPNTKVFAFGTEIPLDSVVLLEQVTFD